MNGVHFLTEVCDTHPYQMGVSMRFLTQALLSLVLGLAPVAAAQTLEETGQLALLHHPSMKLAKSEIALAKEQLFSARASRGVEISIGLSSAIQSIGTDRAFAIDTGETFINSAHIEAVLPLYTSGELTASIEQTRLLVGASEAAYASAEQSLLLSAINAHLNVAQAREAVRIRDQNVSRLKQQFDAAKERFDVGVLTKTDVALAEARYQAGLAGKLAADAELEAAKAVYEELTGQRPGEIGLPKSLPDDYAAADQIFETLKLSNPDLKQLRLLEEVAELGVGIAKSQRKLKVEAYGNAGVQNGSWQNDYQDTSASIGVRASRPLYANGTLLSAERQAVHRAGQAKLQTVQTQNALLRQMSSALAQYAAAVSAVRAAEKEVIAAKTARDGAEIEAGVGLRTTLEVLDQEQDLLDAELRLITAQKNVFITRSQISAFLGELGISYPAD